MRLPRSTPRWAATSWRAARRQAVHDRLAPLRGRVSVNKTNIGMPSARLPLPKTDSEVAYCSGAEDGSVGLNETAAAAVAVVEDDLAHAATDDLCRACACEWVNVAGYEFIQMTSQLENNCHWRRSN